MANKTGIFKKILTYTVPGLTLIIFILILSSGSYLKTHLKEGKKIEVTMRKLEELASSKSWSEAEAKVQVLDDAWQSLAPKVQISSEEDDIQQFSNAIKRLEGYIKGKDSSSALAEIGTLRYTWSRLGK